MAPLGAPREAGRLDADGAVSDPLAGTCVVVPDATTRASLTAIRSLGRRGCAIVAGAPRGGGVGWASRFAAKRFLHPSPEDEPREFAAAVGRAAAEHGAAAVLPAADVPTAALRQHGDALPRGTKLVAPPAEALDLAHDKVRLMALAAELGVPVPDGFEGGPGLEDDPRLERLGFPLVLKPARSRYLADGRWRGASVAIVRDRGELRAALRRDGAFAERPFLAQRLVPGEGCGVFLLARDGEVSCAFAHRRLREKPPWGGVSTLCEAAPPDPALLEHARRLLAALRWSGVAMVEFKRDPTDGRAWLMEINGRFWGSMQLAVAAGIDFPRLWLEQELLGAAAAPPAPIWNVRLWWLLGDLDHFLIRLRRGGAAALPAALRDLRRTRQGRALDFDTLRRDDPRPFLHECRRWLFGAARRRR